MRLPNSTLGVIWAHVGITWSKQWGLRLYRNGVLVAEATKPVRRHFTYHDGIHRFVVGRELSPSAMTWGDEFQMSDLRIWESMVPQNKLEEVYSNMGKCC